MYVIVTAKKELVDLARENGDMIFSDKILTIDFEMDKERRINEFIFKFLGSLAIDPDLDGYRYISYIMERCVMDSDYYTRPLIKCIYTECAEKFGVQYNWVESAIRHAIELSYARVPKMYEKLYNRKLDEKPTNSQFIGKVGEYIKINFK